MAARLLGSTIDFDYRLTDLGVGVLCNIDQLPGARKDLEQVQQWFRIQQLATQPKSFGAGMTLATKTCRSIGHAWLA